MLMRLRRKRKSGKSSAAVASAAERFAFPVAVTKETRELLGLDLSESVFMPPRLSAANVTGLPQDNTNDVRSACVIVDAVTAPIVGTSALSNSGANDAATSDSSFSSNLFAPEVIADEAALLAAVKAYVSADCSFVTGGMSEADRAAIVCARVESTAAVVPSAAAFAASAAAASTAAGAAQKSSPSSAAAEAAKASAAAIPIEFGFSVTGTDLSAFVAVVPEARVVVWLLLVGKEYNSAAPLSPADCKAISDIRSDLCVGSFIRRSLVLSRPALARLAEDAPAAEGDDTTKNGAKADAKGASPAVEVSAVESSVVVAHRRMRIRAVLPSAETTVEDVRCPSVAGGSELFLTIAAAAAGTSAGSDNEAVPAGNYCRVTHHPTMPATWEDEKAITDLTEKEDEFRRNAMRHFLGRVSNSIAFHRVDVSGRGCLWFGEEADGVCCRTYICPNFDIRTGKLSTKRGADKEKGMTIIRWEGPAAEWAQSQKVLSSFLDYFQFQ